jgi:hypothetical protein
LGDRDTALGPESGDAAARRERAAAQRSIERARRTLGLEQAHAAAREQTIEMRL